MGHCKEKRKDGLTPGSFTTMSFQDSLHTIILCIVSKNTTGFCQPGFEEWTKELGYKSTSLVFNN